MTEPFRSGASARSDRANQGISSRPISVSGKNHRAKWQARGQRGSFFKN
jgi:hypothetical protein